MDNHIPSLSVKETLDFAYICQCGYESKGGLACRHAAWAAGFPIEHAQAHKHTGCNVYTAWNVMG